MDYQKRNEIEVYRPLIDAGLLRFVVATDGSEDDAQAALDSVEHDEGPWGYLTKATEAVREYIDMDVVDEVMEFSWVASFLKGTWAKNQAAFGCVATHDDLDPMDFDQPVILEYYPEESRRCLAQQYYVGGSDADVLALWKRKDRTSICHAHMEGFWILGEDSVDFIENYAEKFEKALAEHESE